MAAAAGRSARTVSDVLRWAREAGLIAVVEPGATAAFLGSGHNRSASYVLLAGPTTHDPGQAVDQHGSAERELLCDPRILRCAQALEQRRTAGKTPTPRPLAAVGHTHHSR